VTEQFTMVVGTPSVVAMGRVHVLGMLLADALVVLGIVAGKATHLPGDSPHAWPLQVLFFVGYVRNLGTTNSNHYLAQLRSRRTEFVDLS
jgi:hypothetical protein